MKKIIFSLLFSCALVFGVQAQSATSTTRVTQPTAVLSSDWVLNVPASVPVQPSYPINFKGIENVSAIQTYFTTYKSDAISFKTDAVSGITTLYIQTDYAKAHNWTSRDINTFLNSQVNTFKAGYAAMYPGK